MTEGIIGGIKFIICVLARSQMGQKRREHNRPFTTQVVGGVYSANTIDVDNKNRGGDIDWLDKKEWEDDDEEERKEKQRHMLRCKDRLAHLCQACVLKCLWESGSWLVRRTD